MKFINLKKNKDTNQNNNVMNNQPMMNNQPDYNQMGQPMMNNYDQMGGYNQGMPQQDMYNNQMGQPMMNNYDQAGYYNQGMPQQDMYGNQMEQPMMDNYYQDPNMNQNYPDNYMPTNEEQYVEAQVPMSEAQNQVEEPIVQAEVPVENNVNMEAINNMINIDMAPAPVEEPTPEVTEEVESLEEEEKEEPKLDPLNNANNPIPVNPVAVDVVVDDSDAQKAKTGFFVNIGMCISLFFKPATTIVENTKKYRLTNKAFSVYLWMNVLALLSCIVSRLILGNFVKVLSPVTGRYSIQFNMGRMMMLDNYLGWLIATLCISCVLVLLIALVYYACSFMNSKGISFGTYLMLATIGSVPIVVGLLVLMPVGALISTYFGLILFIISFLYGYLIFITGVINVLNFKNVDSLLRYNLVTMLILGAVLGVVLIVVVRYTSYDLSYLISAAGLG